MHLFRIFQNFLDSVDILNSSGGGGNRGRGGNHRGRGNDFTFPVFQLLHGNPGDYAWGTTGLDAVITQVSLLFS